MTRHIPAVMALASAALLLSACGGGNEPENPRAGEDFTTTISVDDKVVLERVDTLYAVTHDGQLVNTEDAQTLPEILFPVAKTLTVHDGSVITARGATLADPDEVKAFFTQLWAELRAHYGDVAAADLADQIEDLDQMIAELYAVYKDSGLALAAFVDFYEALDESPHFAAQDDAERELTRFLAETGINHAGLLAALEANGLGWRQFLALMAERGQSFNDLLIAHGGSAHGLPMPEFVASYASTQDQEGPKLVSGGYDLAITASQLIWEIIKDSMPRLEVDGARTTILAKADRDPTNYLGAVREESSAVTIDRRGGFKGRTHHFVAKFNVVAYYRAKHPDFGGFWLPSVYFNVQKAEVAGPGGRLNVGATISPIANLGSADTPVPQFDITTTVKASGWWIKSWSESQTFIVNGQRGPWLNTAK